MNAGNTRGKRIHIAILERIVELATAGFGLVAALAWNNVIQEIVTTYIKPYLPFGSSLISLFLYAITITTVAVIITVYLTRLIDKLKRE